MGASTRLPLCGAPFRSWRASRERCSRSADDRLCLDYLSRPATFARVYPKLLEGYLLDALERLDGKRAETQALTGFLAEVESAPRSRGPSAGLGEDVRLRGEDVVGSGLELDGELLQLCAFSTDRPGFGHTRISRPSRRS